MSRSKGDRLKRLVRVAHLMYRREAAELALKQGEAREAAETAAQAEQFADAPLVGGDFFSELSIAFAARSRQKLSEASTRRDAQLDVTLDAMVKKKGAESELGTHSHELKQKQVANGADELQERLLQQATIASLRQAK